MSSRRNRRLTAPEITAQVNLERPIPISVTTVKNRLAEGGLHGRVAVRKPLLRQVNKRKRLEWAREHENWTSEQWNSVLWSDESKFEIFGSNRRVYVRRSAGERMLEACQLPTVKHGGGSVMVWGCFGNGKVGKIFRIEGIMRKEQYQEILLTQMLPSGRDIFQGKFIFQHDNDPKHSAKQIRELLDQWKSDDVLEVMTWPPQSPDLNPIELLWDHLDRCVRKLNPTSENHLWELLQAEWVKITEETLKKLLDRMPKLCKAVIKNKGGHIDEKNPGKS